MLLTKKLFDFEIIDFFKNTGVQLVFPLYRKISFIVYGRVTTHFVAL